MRFRISMSKANCWSRKIWHLRSSWIDTSRLCCSKRCSFSTFKRSWVAITFGRHTPVASKPMPKKIIQRNHISLNISISNFLDRTSLLHRKTMKSWKRSTKICKSSIANSFKAIFREKRKIRILQDIFTLWKKTCTLERQLKRF